MTCHAARRIGEFERRLRRERLEVGRTLVTTDVELESIERHQPGEFLDDSAKAAATAVLVRLEERERRLLEEIEAAEARLAVGTYGVCEGCAGRITMARLRALPTARLCVNCEEALEAAAV